MLLIKVWVLRKNYLKEKKHRKVMRKRSDVAWAIKLQI